MGVSNRLTARSHFPKSAADLTAHAQSRAGANLRPHEWRKIIAEIRAVYGGKLTYAANWFEEFEEVTFWDELDYIGIQGYFPLSEEPDPSLEALVRGWQPFLKRIEALHERYGKPVLFTELGYRSAAGAAAKPWEWPSRGEQVEADPELQARCYEAFFRVFWDRPWLAGVYWWKWHPNHPRAGGLKNGDFTPQNKPAQRVVAERYGRSGT